MLYLERSMSSRVDWSSVEHRRQVDSRAIGAGSGQPSGARASFPSSRFVGKRALRWACLAPLLNDLDFSPNADAERGKRRFSSQPNFHCFRNLVGLRAARRRFQCQENSSCFLGGKRAAKKEVQSFIRAKHFVSIVLIKTRPRGSILAEGNLHRLAPKLNQQSVRRV